MGLFGSIQVDHPACRGNDEDMRSGGTHHARAAAAACGFLLAAVTACSGAPTGLHPGEIPRHGGPSGTAQPSPFEDFTRIPGIGEQLRQRIPGDSGQVVVVYGDHKDSPDSTLVLYQKRGPLWQQSGSWPARNGKQGWTTNHREGDERSPVGVFTLSGAGGLLEDPGTRLPYTQDEDALVSSRHRDGAHRSDLDYVITIDHNRPPGTRPDDPTRTPGRSKGGGIWIQLDHGDGTPGCIGVPRTAMEYLLHTLDPENKPVIVMGDKAALRL